MARIAGINIPPHKRAEINSDLPFLAFGHPSSPRFAGNWHRLHPRRSDLTDGDLEKLRQI